MNSRIEDIYRASPVLGQHAFVTLYGWVLKRKRYGGEFKRYLGELLASQQQPQQSADAEVKHWR